MRTIFFDNRSRLRSGWRALIFFFGLAFVAATLAVLVFRVWEKGDIGVSGSPNVSLLINSLASLLAALLVGWLCARYLEGLPFRSLGISFTKNWHQHLGIGLALGSATLGNAIIMALAFGGLVFTSNSSATSGEIIESLTISLLVFGGAAAFEEIFFRGYVLQSFARSGLAWPAIVLTALFFGFVHMGNPNAGVISSLNTMLAGVWFGVAYLKTRDLWFVWGIHLMWNWVQGAVFGVEVSGITSVTTAPLLLEIDNGPTWLTGENYGIEGGIVCTIAIAISILLIYKLPGLTPDPELLKITSPIDKEVRDLP